MGLSGRQGMSREFPAGGQCRTCLNSFSTRAISHKLRRPLSRADSPNRSASLTPLPSMQSSGSLDLDFRSSGSLAGLLGAEWNDTGIRDPRDNIMLRSIKLEYEMEMLEGVMREERKTRRRKIKAMILEKCVKELPEATVNKVSADEDFGDFHDVLEQHLGINYTAISQPDFEWKLSASEQELVEEVNRNMNRQGDDKAIPKELSELPEFPEEELSDADFTDDFEGAENVQDLSLLDLLSHRADLGEENYRLALCSVLATQHLNTDHFIIETPHSVTENVQPKLLGMMLEKCVRSWPHTNTQEEEEGVIESYVQYIAISRDELKSPKFSWEITDSESDLIQSADDAILQIMDNKLVQADSGPTATPFGLGIFAMVSLSAAVGVVMVAARCVTGPAKGQNKGKKKPLNKKKRN